MLLSMAGVSKSFSGVRALDGVDLEVCSGEIHALVGENGAGKSTLIKVLGGAVVPDGHGLTVLPFVSGERSPGWSNAAEATVMGVHPATTGIEVLQASLEAVSYRVAIVSRLLRPHAAADHEVVASGGAMSASPYWVQLMADVIGRRVHLSPRGELTSRGTAILALRALGAWSTLADEPLAAEDVYEPDPSRAPVYQAALERQHRLYETLVGVDPEIGPALAGAVRGR